MQWAQFQFQESEWGNSRILGHKDVLYIYVGQNTGIFNIAATGLWTLGTTILLIGLIITFYAYFEEDAPVLRKASFFILGGGIRMWLSAACRFSSGFVIPTGAPIILIIGWWIYQENREDEDDEMEPGTDPEEVSDS